MPDARPLVTGHNVGTVGTCRHCGNEWKRAMVPVESLNEERRLRAEAEKVAHSAMWLLRMIQKQKLPLLGYVHTTIREFPEWGLDD